LRGKKRNKQPAPKSEINLWRFFIVNIGAMDENFGEGLILQIKQPNLIIPCKRAGETHLAHTNANDATASTTHVVDTCTAPNAVRCKCMALCDLPQKGCFAKVAERALIFLRGDGF